MVIGVGDGGLGVVVSSICSLFGQAKKFGQGNQKFFTFAKKKISA